MAYPRFWARAPAEQLFQEHNAFISMHEEIQYDCSAITKQPIEVREETTENHCTRELGIIVIT